MTSVNVWLKLEGLLTSSSFPLPVNPDSTFIYELARVVHARFPELIHNGISAERLILRVSDVEVCRSGALVGKYLIGNTDETPLRVQVPEPLRLAIDQSKESLSHGVPNHVGPVKGAQSKPSMKAENLNRHQQASSAFDSIWVYESF